MIGELARNTGMSAVLGDDSFSSPEKTDVSRVCVLSRRVVSDGDSMGRVVCVLYAVCCVLSLSIDERIVFFSRQGKFK